jgi:hypothetical protein
MAIRQILSTERESHHPDPMKEQLIFQAHKGEEDLALEMIRGLLSKIYKI